VVYLQVKLCDPHLSALEVRFSRRGAIQIYTFTFIFTFMSADLRLPILKFSFQVGDVWFCGFYPALLLNEGFWPGGYVRSPYNIAKTKIELVLAVM